MKDYIRKIIRALNRNEFTREYLMIPIIFIRDKSIDLKNYSFIKKGSLGLREFKNIHKGERCFIVGNGPSLTASDMDLIKNEISFGANRIYDLYPKTQWRPTYYGVQDFFVLDEISKEIELEETASKVRFIVSNRPNYVCEKMKKNPRNRFFYLGTCLSEKKEIKFATDFSKTVGNGRTITYALIQLAVYMGFNEIYLLGIDHNYGNYFDQKGNINTKTHAQNHFAGAKEYKKLKANNVDYKRGFLYVPTRAYEKAEKFSRKQGIRIYNVTRGGKLEAFERLKLEDVLYKREN